MRISCQSVFALFLFSFIFVLYFNIDSFRDKYLERYKSIVDSKEMILDGEIRQGRKVGNFTYLRDRIRSTMVLDNSRTILLTILLRIKRIVKTVEETIYFRHFGVVG